MLTVYWQGCHQEPGGLGISSSYYEYGPQLLSYENRRKIESKEIPSRLIPASLWYFTGNLKS